MELTIRIAAQLFKRGSKWCLSPVNQPTLILEFGSIQQAKSFAKSSFWRIIK